MEGTAYFQSAPALLHAADDALYRAKDRGRECIVVYQQGGREVQYPVGNPSS
jgi:PleD family two-component response regulator